MKSIQFLPSALFSEDIIFPRGGTRFGNNPYLYVVVIVSELTYKKVSWWACDILLVGAVLWHHPHSENSLMTTQNKENLAYNDGAMEGVRNHLKILLLNYSHLCTYLHKIM